MQTTLPSPEDILALTADEVADLMHRMMREGVLSDLVKLLNADVLTANSDVSDRAARCLSHMGFVV
jgi:response regulator of citrate/malate metabolism